MQALVGKAASDRSGQSAMRTLVQQFCSLHRLLGHSTNCRDPHLPHGIGPHCPQPPQASRSYFQRESTLREQRQFGGAA